MPIWVNGIQNISSQNARLSLKGQVRDIASGSLIHYNTATSGASSPFVVNFAVNGVNRNFHIFDGGSWNLVVQEISSGGRQALSITRNFGEYKIIIDNRGITIEDVSKNSFALALNGRAWSYYKFFIANANGILTVQGSGTPFRDDAPSEDKVPLTEPLHIEDSGVAEGPDEASVESSTEYVTGGKSTETAGS
ncbi:hypothetical protein ACHQM5_011032 [Ranunculus cassubicifolius]